LSVTEPIDVIVVAAGASRRMGGIDKVMAPIGGRPVLAWSLGAFAASPLTARIVVVASDENLAAISEADWLPRRVTQVAAGGPRRQESVAIGVESLRSRTRGHPADDRMDRVILIHDGARPVVSPSLINAVAYAAQRHGAAIPILPVAETVKRVDGGFVVETVDRTDLATAQTPQGVRASVLLAAYERYPPRGPETWTDEAALLEACRIPVHVVAGESSNIKVTLPDDLRQAQAALGGGCGARVGFGQDSHPFGPGEPLALGGIVIDGAPRLHGHSDGDVVLHAVCDALLGAAGLGDLGRTFPAGPETPEGIASTVMLGEVVRRIGAAGWTVGNLDVTIVAARPRLGARLDAMRAAIAGTLGVAAGRVNVKASTGNLGGDEGAGRSITAVAVASLDPAS
jgi:2-C-methyl-D-erythritol 4-phosphate cytidylyltransferase / 2-C-methyl-D-erythritol 2,4-cyclodiphosphate synthase